MTTERPRQFPGQQLPLPNPSDWATLTDAEQLLSLSRQQIWRMVRGQVLTAYEIGEADRGRVTLFWRAELHEVAEARRRTRLAPPTDPGLGQT